MKKLLIIIAMTAMTTAWAQAPNLQFNGKQCKSMDISAQLVVTCHPYGEEPVPVPVPTPPPSGEPTVMTCSLSGNAGSATGTIFATCSSNVTYYEWSEPTCASYSQSCTVRPNPVGTYTMRARNAQGVSNVASITLRLYGQ